VRSRARLDREGRRSRESGRCILRERKEGKEKKKQGGRIASASLLAAFPVRIFFLQIAPMVAHARARARAHTQSAICSVSFSRPAPARVGES